MIRTRILDRADGAVVRSRVADMLSLIQPAERAVCVKPGMWLWHGPGHGEEIKLR